MSVYSVFYFSICNPTELAEMLHNNCSLRPSGVKLQESTRNTKNEKIILILFGLCNSNTWVETGRVFFSVVAPNFYFCILSLNKKIHYAVYLFLHLSFHLLSHFSLSLLFSILLSKLKAMFHQSNLTTCDAF